MTKEYLLELQEHGYCILKGHFSRGIVNACREAFWPVLLAYLHAHREAPNRGPHRHFLPMPFTPPCFAPEFFFDDEVLRIVRAAIDDRVVADQWGCDASVCGSAHQSPHFDYQRPLFPELPDLALPTYILVISFALFPVTLHNGPIEIARGTHRLPRKEALRAVESGDIPMEPVQTKEKRVVVEEAWPLPAVIVAYHVTYDGHPDSYPLHITSKILSDGQSARIPRELIYNKAIALSAFGSGNITEDPNLFYAVAVLQPGQKPEAAEQALIAEFEKLKREPVSSSELQRAKNQFARDYILGRETDQEKAMHLAHAAVIHNDVTTADGEFDIFTNVTVDDVQRVAKTYFNESNRLVLYILPKVATGTR